MFAKKPPIIRNTSRTFEKQLDNLYARRSAIDDLIRCLREYERFQPKEFVDPKPKRD